ncbi:asparagine synthase (glutamine-hydrolyzing) [Candidatus Nitrospira neomarina]|uniref:asparagine synthase (glutamine-hydrolyzing) n=1 Tax=Candidatus Nitrospira neomarina TaxID=3020899 RepID=A0AA96GUS7_9BACT|nr:asparagine synthase (glutamine-hydrolyzing) [Candidatus Nitrospira neomarina]WNM63986.1 asparagine synthase (glutamine-hydrolyzing) [Candidatus Nitrospira neomarina]
MCGICGIFNVWSGEPVHHAMIERMADTLVHRGPDDAGYYVTGPIGLGHRRLSIIDLEGGHQPMANEDQSVWVVFNGEIYNFQSLHHDLVRKGHQFKTWSDTEVIVHAYEEYGEECFQFFRGMFAIALWDGSKKKLVLARDRVGKKPLYYLVDKDQVAFASEMKAILTVPGVKKEIDLQALSDYFSLLYVPAPKSINKAIRKVQPGHFVRITEKGVEEKEYWDLHFDPNPHRREDEWEERLMDALKEATQLRLISDVPLGAFLSGGIDSSAVVGLMSLLTGKPVQTSSIGFVEEEFNELEYAREIANRFKADHHEVIVKPDAAHILEKLVWFYDEPFADSSAIPTYYVSQVAREYVTVALSGDGGDENFAGYRRYAFDKREEDLRSLLPPGLRKAVFGPLSVLYPKMDWAPRMFRGKATFESLACSHLEAYFRSVSAVSPELKSVLLSQDVLHQLGEYETFELFRSYYEKPVGLDSFSRILYLDIKTYLPDDILVKVDRASMAHSLEVRAPLLDHEFMELVATIPFHLKLRGSTGKYIFKKALGHMLPASILHREKMGFGIPLALWLRQDLKSLAGDVIFSSHDDGLLNKKTVERFWREHQSGLHDRSTVLWTILMFRLWQQVYSYS